MDILDLTKSYDFFQPEQCKERIHIIGCGSVGSAVAELLARFGLTNMTLYDFDTVEPRNLANQMFRQGHVGIPKVEALAAMLEEINPEIRGNLKMVSEGYLGQKLSGYVFLCVDNIDKRREIAVANKDNTHIKAMFDFRTRLADAQHYAARWDDIRMVSDFIHSMGFSHEEAIAETPLSACNVALSAAPTVRLISAYGVCNFINFVKSGALKRLILADAFRFTVDAF